MAVFVKWTILAVFLVSCSILAHPQDGSSSSSSGANDLLTSVKKGLPELRKSLSDFAPSVGDKLADINLPDLPFAVNTSALPSIEEGDKLIEEKCLKNGGNGSYAEAMVAKDELQVCMKDMLDYKKISEEIETAKPTGDLDKVFRKYCRSTPKLKGCINNFTTSIEPCLEESEKISKQVIMNITTALEQFICYKEGDRIALFIGEGGKECISDKWEAIQHCGNVTFSKHLPADINQMPDVTESLPVFKLQKEECLKINEFQKCVVAELTKCKEPTPANIVDSLMNFVRQRTPCREYKPESAGGTAAAHLASSTALLVVFVATLTGLLQ